MFEVVVVAALLGAGFSDDFNDGVMAADWTRFEAGATVQEQNGQLELRSTVATGTHYAGYVSAATWDFRGVQATVEMVSPGDLSVNGWNITLLVSQDATHDVAWLMEGSSAIVMIDDSAGTSLPMSEPFSPAFRWLRVREANGTTYWEHSPDRQNWEVSYSIADPIDFSSAHVALQAGTYQQLSPQRFAVFDNFELVVPTDGGTGGIGGGGGVASRPAPLAVGCGCLTPAGDTLAAVGLLLAARAARRFSSAGARCWRRAGSAARTSGSRRLPTRDRALP